MTDVLEWVTAASIVPVITVADLAEAEAVATALSHGGLPVAEVTLRTPASLDAIAAMTRRDGLLVGAGTVTTLPQLAAAVDAGASFVVSPGLDEEIVAESQRRGIPILPGVATASELQRAVRLGLKAVKLFPANLLGGPAAVKALSAPFPFVRFLPSGGVGPSDLADYLRLPQVLAIGGSWMLPPDLVCRHDVAALTAAVADAVAGVAAARITS